MLCHTCTLDSTGGPGTQSERLFRGLTGGMIVTAIRIGSGVFTGGGESTHRITIIPTMLCRIGDLGGDGGGTGSTGDTGIGGQLIFHTLLR